MARSRCGALALWLIIAWSMAVTLARAIRLPNDYAEAHWLLDYRFGFIKRGLVGSVWGVLGNVLGIPMTPRVILILSCLLLACFFAGLLYVAYRVLRRLQCPADDMLVLLVFATSPFLVMSAHLLGYFDALIYTCCIVSVALALRGYTWLAAVLSAVALLCHESYLLIGYPLVCLAAYMRSDATQSPTRRILSLVPLVTPLLVFVAMALYPSIVVDNGVLKGQLTEHLATFDFIPTRGRAIARWHTASFMDHFERQRVHVFERLLAPGMLGALFPSMLALFYAIHARARIRPFGFVSMLVFGAVLAPLAMHAIAWDTERISSYAVGGAFIAFWIVAELKPGRTVEMFALLAVPAIVLNVFSHYPLMDDEVERFSNGERLLLYVPLFLLLLLFLARRSISVGNSETPEDIDQSGDSGGDGNVREGLTGA